MASIIAMKNRKSKWNLPMVFNSPWKNENKVSEMYHLNFITQFLAGIKMRNLPKSDEIL